jgi:hypothetical protein
LWGLTGCAPQESKKSKSLASHSEMVKSGGLRNILSTKLNNEHC